MKYTITLKDRRTGDEIDYTQPYDYQDKERATADQCVRLQWLEGNFKCDCNRSMFLWDDEGKELPCCQSDTGRRIDLLKIVDATGKQVWPVENNEIP